MGARKKERKKERKRERERDARGERERIIARSCKQEIHLTGEEISFHDILDILHSLHVRIGKEKMLEHLVR